MNQGVGASLGGFQRQSLLLKQQQPPPQQQQQQMLTGNEGGDDCNMDHEQGPSVMDPALLLNAPVYLPAPPGCKAFTCQVAGCGLSLEGMKGYFLRHRVCEEHSKAPVLMIGDTPSRLCQQVRRCTECARVVVIWVSYRCV